MATVDLAEHARELIDHTLYLTLSTIDAASRPWTTPVYFAPLSEREFCWCSDVSADHSRHVAARPQASWVVFDSTVAPYHGRSLYAVGEVRELSGGGIDGALAAYPRPGGTDTTPMTRTEVTGDSPYRLYVATASQLWVLCPRDPRQPCIPHGLNKDHRVLVPGERATP